MIKQILYKLLGREAYLKVVSKTFFFLLRNHWLKGQAAFYNHYMISYLVKPGDRVIDIGANLGYYSVLLSDLVGEDGKVLAVEPVELYRNVLKKNLGLRANVEVLPYALGAEENKEIEMGIPSGHKNFRHGLTHVLDKNEKDASTMVFKATMKHPASLFSSLDRIDFIKCDVEGYEVHIMPLMLGILEKFHPIVQLETNGAARTAMFILFHTLGYEVYGAGEKGILLLNENKRSSYQGDLLFIPVARKGEFANIIET